MTIIQETLEFYKNKVDKFDIVELSYGKGKISLQIPKNRYRYIKPLVLNGISGSRNIRTALLGALENPIGTKPLEELVKNKKVTYLIEDSTRSEPHKELIETCFTKLNKAKFINIIIATGSHKTYSSGNLKIIDHITNAAEEEDVNEYEIVVNDALDKKSFKKIGITAAGTILEVNKKALDCDTFLVNADIKNHYFAGYSNAIKDFLPGICSYKTIEMNHSLALNPDSTFGRHPFHPDPKRRENPLAIDMCDAAKMIKDYQKERDIFILSTITFNNELIWTAAGDIAETTKAGIEKIDQFASFKIKPSNFLIISPGGYPQDQSLHTTQRGVDLCKEAVKENGEILVVSECSEGIAHNHNAERFFYQKLAMAKSLDDVMENIEKKYVLYTHKAYKSAELLKKVNSIYMFTNLDNKSVESVHMKKIEDPQDIVDKWLAISDDTINIVDKANKIAIYTK